MNMPDIVVRTLKSCEKILLQIILIFRILFHKPVEFNNTALVLCKEQEALDNETPITPANKTDWLLFFLFLVKEKKASQTVLTWFQASILVLIKCNLD